MNKSYISSSEADISYFHQEKDISSRKKEFSIYYIFFSVKENSSKI